MCDPYAIEVVNPDDFLTDLYDRYPTELRAAIEHQAAALTRPPLTVDNLLTRLEATVPRFAERCKPPS